MRSEAEAPANAPPLNATPSISTVLLVKSFPCELQFTALLLETKTTLFEPLVRNMSWPKVMVFKIRSFVETFVADQEPALNRLVTELVLKVVEFAPTETKFELPS